MIPRWRHVACLDAKYFCTVSTVNQMGDEMHNVWQRSGLPADYWECRSSLGYQVTGSLGKPLLAAFFYLKYIKTVELFLHTHEF